MNVAAAAVVKPMPAVLQPVCPAGCRPGAADTRVSDPGPGHNTHTSHRHRATFTHNSMAKIFLLVKIVRYS